MTLENLEVGMRIPNYRKLCSLLGEPVQDGNSKKAQLREWGRYFSFEREGNAYIITEVFQAAKLSEDRRASYMRYLEPLLFQYLGKRRGTAEHSFQVWSTELGMTSPRVYDESELTFWTAPNQFKYYLVHRTANEVATKTKEVLLSTVSALEKKGLVSKTINTYIVENMAHRIATTEEENIIESVKRQVLEELGVTNMFSVNVNAWKRKSFYERVNTIFQEKYGWSSAYTLLRVTVTDNALIKTYENIEETALKQNLRNELQSAILTKLNNNARISSGKLEEAWEQDSSAEMDGQFQFYLSEMDINSVEFLLKELM